MFSGKLECAADRPYTPPVVLRSQGLSDIGQNPAPTTLTSHIQGSVQVTSINSDGQDYLGTAVCTFLICFWTSRHSARGSHHLAPLLCSLQATSGTSHPGSRTRFRRRMTTLTARSSSSCVPYTTLLFSPAQRLPDRSSMRVISAKTRRSWYETLPFIVYFRRSARTLTSRFCSFSPRPCFPSSPLRTRRPAAPAVPLLPAHRLARACAEGGARKELPDQYVRVRPYPGRAALHLPER